MSQIRGAQPKTAKIGQYGVYLCSGEPIATIFLPVLRLNIKEFTVLELNQSYYCGASDKQIIYRTIGSCLDDICAQYPDNEALVVRHQNVRWTYRELHARVEQLASGLLSLGIELGDRVGIWGPNSAEWALVQYATAKIGAIMVCINPAYRLHELEFALNKVQCKAIVAAQEFKTSHYLEMLQTLAPELAQCAPGELQAEKFPHLRTVIRMGDEATPGMFNFDAVCDSGTAEHCASMVEIGATLRPDDPINIQFTSGTTGTPKGATLTHCNILNNGYLCAVGMGFTDQDRLCIPVPLYHCFGMVMGNLACLSHGATAVYPSDGFDPLLTLQTIAQERCTGLHGVPTMFINELDHPDFDSFDLSSLRTGIMAGAPCPVEVMKKVIDRMNMSEVLIAYGQTETSPVNHMTIASDSLQKRTETVGRAVPWVEIKIINEHGQVVAPGETGEICARGYSVMQGYWSDEERTAETIDAANWLHSGDLGVMDTAGYVQVVGRIKDMIIRGGENIYPREVEEFLYTHPDIAEVQVFGIVDARMGEEVCAWVQLRPGQTMTPDELVKFCRDQITHFKIPRHIRFVEEYPMTVTGKIQKFLMREQMVKMLDG
ncbi:MAG: fatty-acyl-CoA synthase [Bacteroidia bacterium]|jgi:fatty-acyl-CoA synthase